MAPDPVPVNMTFAEMVDGGWIQEANRLFFHPHGLSLTIRMKGKSRIPAALEILDGRYDFEGFSFEDEQIDPHKVVQVFMERQRHSPARRRKWGETEIQPVDMSGYAKKEPDADGAG